MNQAQKLLVQMNKMLDKKNLLSLGIGLGVAYYFLVMKPKAEAKKRRDLQRLNREGIIFANPNIPMPEYIEQEGDSEAFQRLLKEGVFTTQIPLNYDN